MSQFRVTKEWTETAVYVATKVFEADSADAAEEMADDEDNEVSDGWSVEGDVIHGSDTDTTVEEFISDQTVETLNFLERHGHRP
jgi:hypothetical protein